MNRATEIRLLAERQMGEFLKQMPKNDGGRPVEKTSSRAEPVSTPATLAEIGITKKESSRAQKLAEMPPVQLNRLDSIGRPSSVADSSMNIEGPTPADVNERSCRTCKYWDFHSEKDKDEAAICRRRAPTAAPRLGQNHDVNNDLGHAMWPLTQAFDWCGDWVDDETQRAQPKS